MFTAKSLGFSDDLIASVKKAMETGRKISTETLEEQVSSGNWQVEAQEGPIASIYETSSRSRFKVEVLDESFSSASKKMEASRQRALKKAKTWMKKTGKSAEDAIKEFDLLPGDLKHLKEAKMDPVGKEDDDINNDGKVNKSDRYLAKRRHAIRLAKSRKSGNIEARMEATELEEAPVSMMRSYDSNKDLRLLNRLSLKRKQGKALSSSEERAERNAKSRLSARGPRMEELELDEAKNKAAMEKTDADIAQARKYLKAADNHADVIKHMNTISRLEKQKKYQQMRMQEAKETKAEMEDEDGDGQKDSKKKKGKAEKCDTVDTKPTDNKTMVQTEELELAEASMSPSEKAKFDRLKKKHEGGSMQKAMRSQYGSEKGDNIFYGKLTKMAMGEEVDLNDFILDEEELEELSKKTLGSYIMKATSSYGDAKERLSNAINKSGYTSADRELYRRQKKNRTFGINRAVDKLTKEELELDEAWMHPSHEKELKDPKTSKKQKAKILALYKKKAGDEDKEAGEAWKEKMAAKRQGRIYHESTDQPVKRGRGRPRKDAAASGEGTEAGDRHIVSQMRKAVSLNGNHVVFDNGEKKHVSRDTAQGFLNKYHGLDKPMHKEILAKSAIKSHNHFQNAMKGKVEAPKKSKISMPVLKSDVMDK